MPDKLLAILWRDFQAAKSYRLSFLFQMVGPLFMLLAFFFLAQLIKDAFLVDLARYGGDYFAFALIGIVFSTYVGVSLYSAVATIQANQSNGTLEVLLTTRVGLGTIVLGSSLYGFISRTVFIVLYLLLGATVFGIDLSHANLLTAFVTLTLTVLVMLGLGLLSASFVLVFKRGDPVNLVLSQSSFLLSGVFYPVSVLPDWLRVGSAILPHTYALEALRLGLLQGYSLGDVAPQLGALALFVVAFLPLGLSAFRMALYQARVEGSLAHF